MTIFLQELHLCCKSTTCNELPVWSSSNSLRIRFLKKKSKKLKKHLEKLYNFCPYKLFVCVILSATKDLRTSTPYAFTFFYFAFTICGTSYEKFIITITISRSMKQMKKNFEFAVNACKNSFFLLFSVYIFISKFYFIVLYRFPYREALW